MTTGESLDNPSFMSGEASFTEHASGNYALRMVRRN